MNTGKIIAVTVLGSLAGLLLGFAITTAQYRNDAPHAPAVVQAAAAGQPGDSAADPPAPSDRRLAHIGGSFVTDVYKRVSPAVVHITNNVQYMDFFYGPQTRAAT